MPILSQEQPTPPRRDEAMDKPPRTADPGDRHAQARDLRKARKLAARQARLGANQPLPVRQAQPYPTTPVPLSAGMLQHFGERRAAASRTLKEALARREFGTQEADAQFEFFKNQTDRLFKRSRRDTAGQMGDRGLAFSPGGLGRALVDLRDAQAEQVAGLDQTRASQLRGLEEAVRMAELAREEELAAIARDEARGHADLSGLFFGAPGQANPFDSPYRLF